AAAPPPDSPFRAVGGAWVLSRRAITQDVMAEAAQLPTVALPLVTLGTSDDGERVLLNLRATTSASVAGSRETAVAFLAAAATELANGSWIESGRLVLAGLGEHLGGLPRVIAVPSVVDVGVLRAGDVLVSADPPGAVVEGL